MSCFPTSAAISLDKLISEVNGADPSLCQCCIVLLQRGKTALKQSAPAPGALPCPRKQGSARRDHPKAQRLSKPFWGRSGVRGATTPSDSGGCFGAAG